MVVLSGLGETNTIISQQQSMLRPSVCVTAKHSVKQLMVCTLALYFRCFAGYPVIVAANRDEHYDRPSAQPSLLSSEPKTIAGIDLRAGGTWLGVNEFGLTVGILNRRIDGTTLPATVARSRGLLCQELLKCKSAVAAAAFLTGHESRYNPFTLVFADDERAYMAYNEDPAIVTRELASGLHVFSSASEVDLRSAKADRAHRLFAELANRKRNPEPEPQQFLQSLQKILADHALNDGSADPGDAICVHRENSGTVSSSVIFYAKAGRRFETFHCLGAPCQNPFGTSLALPIR
jgi:uncharacterized protein with NRDE domain